MHGGGDWTNVIIPGDSQRTRYYYIIKIVIICFCANIKKLLKILQINFAFVLHFSALQFNHRKNYMVKDLRPDAEYECLVQARNKFGWSDASRIFHFFSGKSRKNTN